MEEFKVQNFHSSKLNSVNVCTQLDKEGSKWILIYHYMGNLFFYGWNELRMLTACWALR